ncbi:metal ABC transporter substrate-binding protein [Actinomyces sp. MRS3W]|nr:metal ABC transporter substrate-binding protein [Actinomyces sp. MRS3W]MDU0349498.1 metal ABC transporter substrate-binding protein [Actinomyces sp. MRS3W]
MNILSPARRGIAAAAALSLAGVSLAACSTDSTPADGTNTGQTGETLSVAASFYPIQYLTEAVGGDHVDVTSVTPTNVEPHDYELAPKDVTALSATNLVVYVAGFQPSLDDALAEVSGPTVLELSATVDLVHHDGVAHDHDEDTEDTEEEADHDAAESTDPHFWLDPVRMQAAAQAIETALAQADPDHAADYEANLATLTDTLEGLDADYSNGLAQCERTTFVTAHSAFGYLADRYGLTQASVSGLDPESEPSPSELAAVKKIVEETGTTTIFTEELVSPKTAEALAAETGATTAVLNPIESAPASGDYAGAMTTNLEELRTALSCE